MDFNLSEKHKHIQSIARKFSYEEIAPVALERDKISDWEKRMPWDLTEKASKLGLRQLPYPEQYGGLNGDVVFDEDTYHFIKDDYSTQDIGEHSLKGFEKPVKVFKLKSE